MGMKSMDPCAYVYESGDHDSDPVCGRSRVAHAQLDHDFVSADEASEATDAREAAHGAGGRLAVHDVLVRVDADCYLNPSMIAAMIEIERHQRSFSPTLPPHTAVYLVGRAEPIVVEMGLDTLAKLLDATT